jgi:ABC-2 type transport system permease protein
VSKDLRRQRLRAIVQLSLMRFRLFYREPGSMFWSFGFPIVLSLVLGIAFRNQKPEPVLVAIEQPSDALAERAEHAREILAKASGVHVAGVMSGAEASAALRTGKVSLLVAPVPDAGWAYRFDETRPESRLARAVTDEALQRGEGRVDAFTPAVRLMTEPGSRYIDFLVPGLIGMGLMSSGLWGIGFSLVEMRTKKLLKRLTATPMRRSDLLLSFLVVRSMLLPFELAPLLAFAHFAFGVEMRGSFAGFGAITLLGSATFAGMGLFLGSRTENPQVIMGFINVVSFPMYLCSGVFFSSSRFPDVMRPIVRFMPLTALNDALRATMIDGASLVHVRTELAILAAWGGLSFLLAVRLFRWR